MDKHFLHMIPLILFTTLAITATGLLIGIGFLSIANTPYPEVKTLFLLSFGLIGIGTLLSLFHLGKKKRFVFAISGLKHSWLSIEVILAAMVSGLSGATFMLLNTHSSESLIDLTAMASIVCGLLLVLSIGMVYHIPIRPTWKGFSNIGSALFSSLLLGAYLFFFTYKTYVALGMFLLIWLIDYFMAMIRAKALLNLMHNEHGFVFPHLLRPVNWLYTTRQFIPFVTLILARIFFHTPTLIMLITTILIDRLCFYGSMSETSPKSVIATLKKERLSEPF